MVVLVCHTSAIRVLCRRLFRLAADMQQVHAAETRRPHGASATPWGLKWALDTSAPGIRSGPMWSGLSGRMLVTGLIRLGVRAATETLKGETTLPQKLLMRNRRHAGAKFCLWKKIRRRTKTSRPISRSIQNIFSNPFFYPDFLMSVFHDKLQNARWNRKSTLAHSEFHIERHKTVPMSF